MSTMSMFTPDEPRREDFEALTDKRLVRSTGLPSAAQLLAENTELFLDWETTAISAKEGRPFMCGWWTPEGGAQVIDFRHLGEAGERAVIDGLNARGRAGKVTASFNSGFEDQHAKTLGIKLGPMWCSQSAAFAVNELRKPFGEFGPMTQKALIKHELNLEPKYAMAVSQWMKTHLGSGQEKYQLIPAPLVVPYCCEDLETGAALHKKIEKQVIANEQVELVRTDSELGRVVEEVEARGLRLNLPAARALAEEFSAALLVSAKNLFDAVGRQFDFESNPKVFGLLYGEMRLPLHADIEKEGSVDDDVLKWMLSLEDVKNSARYTTIIKCLMECREYSKLKNTYLLPWIYEHAKGGILYTTLNMRTTRTRRFSSKEPNLQNIPVRTKLGRKLRQLFISRDGFTTYSMDESQAEYRAFAHYSQDPGLLDAYRKGGRKADLHQMVSDMLNVDRDTVGKHLNFGMVYGLGKDKLARKLMRSKEDSAKILDWYHSKFPGIKMLKPKLEAMVRQFGYVRDIFGGRRHMTVNEAYKGINSICQMTVANLIRKAMVNAYNVLNSEGACSFNGSILLQVHDELPFELEGEGPDAWEAHKPILRRMRDEAMENFPQFSVPIISSCDRWAPNWYDTEGVVL